MAVYDIVIIGAGPAGLTAAIYALRAKKSVLLIEKNALGGQMTFSPKIENYPGFLELSGNELADKMTEQVLSLGGEMEFDTVTGISEGEVKTVRAEGGEYQARAVIIASGAAHRRLGLPNEEGLIGRGVSFCAVCDAAFFNGMYVCVAGGGNSALQEALLLSENCSRVTMIQNLDFLTGEETLKEKVAAKENIDVIYGSVVSGLTENADGLTGVEITETATGARRVIETNGLFVAVGLAPDTAPFKGLVALDDYGCVESDERCLTNVPGIFAAGDCRVKQVRQVSTACADGAVAAIAAVKYLG